MALLSGRKKGFLPGGLFCFAPQQFIGALALLFLSSCQAEANTYAQSIAARAQVVKDTIPADTTSVAPEPEAPTTYTIIGVGDMMLGTNYPSASYLPPKGGTTMLAEMENLLRGADVTFGNLEGTILDEGGTAKRCNNPKACYVFRSPESYAKHFQKAGFDFLSIANNHSGDFGLAGRKRTKAVLDEAGIAYAGLAGSDEYAIIERNGLKVGMVAFAPNSGTVSIHNYTKARELVQKLEAECDVVIVSFHGGAEGAKHQRVPRTRETYYGENRGNVYEFAHAMVDAGADIIFGHGPHVTRAMELYQDRLICYSLGNFCTYGRFNLSGEAGIAPLVKVEVDADGQFVGGTVVPVYQSYNHGPKADPQKRAIKTLLRLNVSDFPESPLILDEDGTLSKRQ
ncbi:MAG: CapA family protein [Phaeodactylibacter sp.]|uniref:CapA family protein n=1 Tax=Phaeodactylibacter sp. TaxID=1940289 RepID=UPI0032EF6DC8